MLKNLRVTVWELSEMRPDVSKNSIDKILTNYLEYAKVCASKKLKEEVLSYFYGASGEFDDSSIKKIVHYIQKYIDLNGNYVKKKKNRKIEK